MTRARGRRRAAGRGRAQVVITTPEPERYRGVQLPSIASVRHRDDIGAVQAELAAVEGRDRADPRRPLRDREAPDAQARPARDAGRARLHQRARVRGLRRLRREVLVPVGAAGADRVRAQDPDPPELVQPRHELRQGRLPVVPAGRARDAARERTARSGGARGPAGADLAGSRRRPDSHARRWRYRRGDGRSDPAYRRPS